MVPDLWGGCLGERQVLMKPDDPSSKCPVYTVPITSQIDDPPGLHSGGAQDTTHQLPDTTPVDNMAVYFGQQHNCDVHDGMVSGELKDVGDDGGRGGLYQTPSQPSFQPRGLFQPINQQ